MACYHPIKGFRSRILSSAGKRGLTMSPMMAHKDWLGNPEELQVPCGQCIGCRLERSRQWAVRLMHENQMHSQSAFLTLTYNDEHLPRHGSLNLKHFQDFMKRYRRWLKNKKIRFFHCGEYGENFGRPHYHSIIFGHDFSDKLYEYTSDRGDKVYKSDMLEKLWTHGGCKIGDVTFESAAYVARYVTEKVTGENAPYWYNDINPDTGEITRERSVEYVTMSRRPGIGKTWYDKFNKDVFPRDEVVMRGVEMKTPGYYDRLYEKERPARFKKIKADRVEAAEKPENAQHNTWERLLVREEIAKSKLKNQLKRKLK